MFLTLQNPVFLPIAVSFRDWFAPAREWSTFSKTGSRKSYCFVVDFGLYLNTVTRNRTLVLKRFFVIFGRFSLIFDDSIKEMEVLY